MLVRYLRNQGSDVADDVASEVWIAVARNLPRFVGDEVGFRRWLFTIARRRLIEAWRKQAHRPTIAAPAERLDGPGSPPGQDDPASLVVDQLSAREAIDAVVAGLTPDQAEVVVLRIVAGFDVAEVAAIMGRSPSSVRVLCHRALHRLKTRFPIEALIE
jgi:RNA polymerase sigma-70 factor, ECF subfamily